MTKGLGRRASIYASLMGLLGLDKVRGGNGQLATRPLTNIEYIQDPESRRLQIEKAVAKRARRAAKRAQLGLSLLLAVLMLLPRTAQAVDWKAWAARATLVGGVAADLWTTQRGLNRGAVETNPLVGNNAVQRYTVMIGAGGLTLAVNEIARRAGHPTLANWTEAVGGGLHAAVALHNQDVINSLSAAEGRAVARTVRPRTPASLYVGPPLILPGGGD